MSFTLQLLHAADQEAGIPALDDAVRFSSVLNALRAQDVGADGILTLSSGDAYIPGPFLLASSFISEPVAGFDLGVSGRADILIQNQLGFEAIALGNHEFDLGTAFLGGLIRPSGNYPGTAFPFLSTNLDVTTDSALANLVVPDGQAPQPNSITGSVVIDVNGTNFGIIGATTPTLGTISSPGNVTISPSPFGGNPSQAELQALADIIQEAIDALTGEGINHIILLAHMQQLSIERELAKLLRDVDIIVAGGSNTLLADETDILRAGDAVQGPYPILETSAAGDPVAVVNTDGNYKYVGRLVVTFDENGIIDPNSIDAAISGAYATDEAGVQRVGGEGLEDPVIVELTDALREVIVAQDGTLTGKTKFFLNGERNDVRTQETNLGNLTADANLFVAKQSDPKVVVSLKNGGGIRDNIGVIDVPPGSTDPNDIRKLPPQANALVGKEEGDISQLDITNALRFNNGLSLVTVTAEGLKLLLEHGVAGTAPGATPGRFPQVGGLSFSFDATRQAIAFDSEGNVTTPGDRIRNLAIVDEEGRVIDVIVRNGNVVGNPNRPIRMVTLDFLANNNDVNNPGLGGDGYPFPALATDVVSLLEEDVRRGKARFADNGTEQDALAEYLIANFSETPFKERDRGPRKDERIQNLEVRNDQVLRRSFVLNGTRGDDVLEGGNRADILRGRAGDDVLIGNGGNDRLIGGPGNDVLFGGRGRNRLVDNQGRNTFVLANAGGVDTIVSFNRRRDTIGLIDLAFRDLTITSNNKRATIAVGDTVLARVNGASADDFSRSNVQTVAIEDFLP
jgi:2',3'-cyclic-nucleotide 2'-phosphodiesterase/3'-nucleotidase/5'-nucleotidase